MSEPSNYPRPAPGNAQGSLCPQCGQWAGKPVKYTWWGGIVGPAIFNLDKCAACRCNFNRKTGKSAKKAILIYNLVVIGLAILVGVVGVIAKS